MHEKQTLCVPTKIYTYNMVHFKGYLNKLIQLNSFIANFETYKMCFTCAVKLPYKDTIIDKLP